MLCLKQGLVDMEETMSNSDGKTYEIGLVMAGAISAGAYTAGVVDYLLEALMHYRKVRKQFADEHPGQSLHNVQIRVISGASAGGMTGSMLLNAMCDENYRPMYGYSPSTVTESDVLKNVFYRSWVSEAHGIDIDFMLDTKDITGKAPLKSLLNCERLTQIADNAFSHPRILQPYDYIPSRIDHFLSVFNLGGVPYVLDFDGSKSKFAMVNHSDMMHFVYDNQSNAKFNTNDIPLLDDSTNVLNSNWKLLSQCTLATGAFPIALEYRDIAKDRDSYNEWKWWVPQSDTKTSCDNKGSCFQLTNISPQWESTLKTGYRFVAMDGGIANNEPLEVARRALARDDLFNPRSADDAKRSVIMVDPFPAEPLEPFTYEGKTLFGMASKLFGSLKEQARFKPEEIMLANDPNIFSRYLIAPSRNGAEVGYELASSSLGAFGGFISEKFRQHDFQLGRKNAQSFLMDHFYIGVHNKLVEDNLDWFREKGCIVDEQYVQIIPMVDLADHKITEEIIPVDFASIAMTQKEFESLMQKIEMRVKAVFVKSYLLNKFLAGKTENWFMKILKLLMKLGWVKGKIIAAISNLITDEIGDKMKSDLTIRRLLK